MERAKEILHGAWNAVRKFMAYAPNKKHIKSAPYKPYNEIKNPLSYLRDSATLFSDMNRGFILSLCILLISYYYISTFNISFINPSSFNALFIGTDLLYRNGHFINNGLLKIIEYAVIQLSMMPFVFYIVRKEQYKDKKFNYFAPFKEGVLWHAYASLMILFSMLFIFIFYKIPTSLFLLMIFLIFKFLTVNSTYWMMELRIKRAPCIGPAEKLYSYLFFILITFTIFYIARIFQYVLFLESTDLSSWKSHFSLPFIQTFGLGIFLGLELLMFGTTAKLIQNSHDNPSDFKKSKEKALIVKQWRHYVKNGCNVFKPITNVCLSLGGFFLCFYIFAEVGLLQGGLLHLTELCNAPKTVNQWMPLFFLMLCSIPFLIYGTKILDPKNEARNYFSYFTLQKYWIIAFLATLFILFSYFIFFKNQNIKVYIYSSFFVFLFCLFCSYVFVLCLTIAVDRSFLFLKGGWRIFDYLFIFLLPIFLVAWIIIFYLECSHPLESLPALEQFFLIKNHSEALLLTIKMTLFEAILIYYVGVLSCVCQDALFVEEQGLENYEKEFSLRKRV